MPFCIQCGNELPLNAKFCSNCGTKSVHLEEKVFFSGDKLNNFEYNDLIICGDNVAYKGEMKNSKRDGFGIYFTKFMNSEYSKEYEGKWEGNFFKGDGIQYHYPGYILREGYFDQRGNYFKGKYNTPVFDEDKKEIIGVLRYEGEMCVDTDLRNSLESESYLQYDVYINNEDFNGAYNYFSGSMVPNGYGISYYVDGTIEYQGYWKLGNPHGQGLHNFIDDKDGGMVSSIYWIDSSVIEGEFLESSLAHGRITYENGDIHEGEFVDEILNGQGKITFSSGDINEGYFVNGALNGQGKIIMTNGNILEGSFIENEINGTGKLSSTEGAFVGEFQNGLPIGLFVFINNDGVKIEGEFKVENSNWNFINSENPQLKNNFNNPNVSPIPFKDGAGIR